MLSTRRPSFTVSPWRARAASSPRPRPPTRACFTERRTGRHRPQNKNNTRGEVCYGRDNKIRGWPHITGDSARGGDARMVSGWERGGWEGKRGREDESRAGIAIAVLVDIVVVAVVGDLWRGGDGGRGGETGSVTAGETGMGTCASSLACTTPSPILTTPPNARRRRARSLPSPPLPPELNRASDGVSRSCSSRPRSAGARSP